MYKLYSLHTPRTPDTPGTLETPGTPDGLDMAVVLDSGRRGQKTRRAPAGGLRPRLQRPNWRRLS